MAIIEFAKVKETKAKNTRIKETRAKETMVKAEKVKVEKENTLTNSLTAKTAAEIEELTETQEKVNAILGERPRATKQQALIAKILTNLESQMKAAEKLETLKKNEAGLRQELADFINVKQKAERKGNG